MDQTGKDIQDGFNVIRDGVKEAGRRRNAELVAKQGYVAFKNPDAVALFHANPEYVAWTCKFVDGEYRFYPPAKEKEKLMAESQKLENEAPLKAVQETVTSETIASENVIKEEVVDTKSIVETYKKEIADPTKTTFVSVTVLPLQPDKCRYKLISTDKRTGQENVVQEFVTEFAGKFSMEVLPSLYNKLMGGLPVMDHEKNDGDLSTVIFQDIEAGKTMALGNLTPEQLELIKNMKSFVDGQYFNAPEEIRGIHR